MSGGNLMSEAEFRAYKAGVHNMIKDAPRDSNGFVMVKPESDEERDLLGRAMKELNEEGHFSPLRANSSRLLR
jgi:hypothetical protein